MGLYGAAWPLGDHFFVCGGGGHGLVNRIVWASFRGGRMVLAPSGSALILGMNDGGVRRFQLDLSGPSPRLIEVSAAFTERFQCLQEEVDSMAFTPDGALLAVGFSTGDLKVLAYPTMKPLVHWKLESDVKDLDFAWQHGGGPQQGPLLATVCDKGTCQLWDVRSCSAVCQLQLPRGLERAKFSRCRFSRSAPILYVTMNLVRGRRPPRIKPAECSSRATERPRHAEVCGAVV
ncbi:hypothetical protein MNEG_14344 [Monoraphidium neglectum]|uniref:Anaphase-promoting complex subunit 4-like WD40 domain-containing protein n=1 Tax=Monoraphidium neglectum TaxID=145388 RepID=A0A0D2LPE6_9CHLO|nr:hypothetical protein MNEG_14344 [Monoraphidium neglectum]KIY93619.1 hypothetical protein MNEG_14344 [Monoraphidium neglectum]|eukprot:XP_013892639.1 hypothetical protein MNEG_14344 [Monoraphidium neglectum]